MKVKEKNKSKGEQRNITPILHESRLNASMSNSNSILPYMLIKMKKRGETSYN